MRIKLFKKLALFFLLFSGHMFVSLSPKNNQEVSVYTMQEKQGILVGVRLLNKTEIRNAFYSVNELSNLSIARRYKVIEFLIHNKTKTDLLFDAKNITLACENPTIIKKKLNFNVTPLPFFAGISSALLLVLGLGLAMVPSVIIGATITIATAPLNTHAINKTMSLSLQAKSGDLKHPLLIPPCEQEKRIIFVRQEHFKKDFSVSFTDFVQNTQISFDFHLGK